MVHPWLVRLLAQQHIDDLLRDSGVGRPRPERPPAAASEIRARVGRRATAFLRAARGAA